MKISFFKKEVEKLLKIAETLPPAIVPYTGEEWEKILGPQAKEKTEKGLLLVADHGIYLMPNSKGLKKQNGEYPTAYCLECNPHTQDFESWWDKKQEIFGPDDGCIFLDITNTKRWVGTSKSDTCLVEVNSENVSLIF